MYYLHQRLHARPDLLHLIKSNEYIEEKATSDASESIAHENNSVPLVSSGGGIVSNSSGGASGAGGGASSAVRSGHKRFKRIVPVPSSLHQPAAVYSHVPASGTGADAVSSNNNSSTTNNAVHASSGSGGGGSGSATQTLGGSRRSSVRGYLAIPSGTSRGAEDGSGSGSGSSSVGGTRGSTENSETTGEESSEGKKSNSSSESQIREVLAEQKYFGVLLQNFEAIFESLHNKKVLLAALRKDPNAPDHLIADLHDDIHVLSSLKKEFRNKLRNTLE